MSKTQILKDQILSIAWNLPSDTIREVAGELESLSSNREKEVFETIPEQDREELISLYKQVHANPYGGDNSCKSVELSIPVKIKFIISSEGDFDEEIMKFESAISSYVHGDSRVNVNQLYELEEIKELPEIKELLAENKKILSQFAALLNKVADAHCLNRFTLYDLIRDEI